MTVDARGMLHIFNATERGGLSTYNPLTNSWSSFAYPWFRTINVGYHGKIASLGTNVFVSILDDFESSIRGLYRINTLNGSWTRFGFHNPNEGAIDLNIGKDGKLYALCGQGGPTGRRFQVYDPASLALQYTVDLTNHVYSPGNSDLWDLVPRPAGGFFAGHQMGPSYILSTTGEVTQTLNQGTGNMMDADIYADGSYVQLNRSGLVTLRNNSFGLVRSFSSGNTSGGFISFVPVPEPGSLLTVCVGAILLMRRKR